jgi:hypothetical protein
MYESELKPSQNEGSTQYFLFHFPSSAEQTSAYYNMINLRIWHQILSAQVRALDNHAHADWATGFLPGMGDVSSKSRSYLGFQFPWYTFSLQHLPLVCFRWGK